MFDYTCLATIQEYLKKCFPGAFVRGFVGTILRRGDAHVFEIGEAEAVATLTVSHEFLSASAGALEQRLEEHAVADHLRREGWVVVHADGGIEALERSRARSYVGPFGMFRRSMARFT